MRRTDNRKPNELRPVSFAVDYVVYPEGSVLISTGRTKVLCNVTIEAGVPPWIEKKGTPGGWITAEYSMLPRSTHTRTKREAAVTGSRSQEIRRVIGRALRAAVNLQKLGKITCTIDCDVIQADGGTRTAAITGGFVALYLALTKLVKRGELPKGVIKSHVAAVSAGLVRGVPLLDLCYLEDSSADADANFVIDEHGKIIEIQATAEKRPFSTQQLSTLLRMAQNAIKQLIKSQKQALAAYRGW